MVTKPTEPLLERLSDFLSRLTPGTAAKLASGLEQQERQGPSGLPYEFILSSIRPLLRRWSGGRPGTPSAIRLFCLPFEDLLVDRRDRASRVRQIERGSVMPVWRWLETDLLPDTLPDIAARLSGKAAEADGVTLAGRLTILHASCSSAILSALDEARRDQTLRRKIEHQLGGEEAVEDAAEMAKALEVAPYLMSLRERLPGRIADFDDATVASVAEIYEEARAVAPESAIHVALAAFMRLDEPCQILRLARKLVGFGNDAAVSRSGLAELGEIFLGELEDIAKSAQTRRAGQADLDHLQSQVTRFAEVSQAFIREIDIRRCGDWGHRILAARAGLSTAIAEELSRFEVELARALPLHQIGSYGRNGPRRPDVAAAPNFARVDRMLAAFRFIRGACPATETIGAQAHCKAVGQQLEAYLVTYEDGLIEDLRRVKGAQRANALAFLDVVVGFRETLGADSLAATLRRRGQVAVAQAS